MKRKLNLLTTILLLNFTSLSQIDTSKICFEKDIVKRISIDLLKCDSISTELEHSKSLITLKDSVISKNNNSIELLLLKQSNQQSIIDLHINKETLYVKRENELVDQNATLAKKNKNKNKGLIITTTTSVLLAILTAIFIIK